MGNQPSHGEAEHQPGQVDWRRSVPLAAADSISVSGEQKSDLQRPSISSTNGRHSPNSHSTTTSDIALCSTLQQPVPKPRNRAKRKSVDQRRSNGPLLSAADNLSTDRGLNDAADNTDRVAQSARPAKASAREKSVLPEDQSPNYPRLAFERPLSVTGGESELVLLQRQQQQQQCCPADSGIASRSVSHCDQQQSTRTASFYEFLGIAPDYLDKALSLDVRFDLEAAETVSSHQSAEICREHSLDLDSPQIPTAATRSAVARQIVICQDIWDISGESLSDYDDNEESINKTMEDSPLCSNGESPRLDNEKGATVSLEVRTESEKYKTCAMSSAERSDDDTTAVSNGCEVIDHSSRTMEFNSCSWSHPLDLTTDVGDHFTETATEVTASNVKVCETEQKRSEKASEHLPTGTEHLLRDQENIVIEDINSNKVLPELRYDAAAAAAAAAAGELTSGVASNLQEPSCNSEVAVLNHVAVDVQAEDGHADTLLQMGAAADEPREENGDDSHASSIFSSAPSAAAADDDDADAAAYTAEHAAADTDAADATDADAAAHIDAAVGTGTTQFVDCQFASLTIDKSSTTTSLDPHDRESNQDIRSFDNAMVSPSTANSEQEQFQLAQGCEELTQTSTCVSGPETTDEAADQQPSDMPAEQSTLIADHEGDILITCGDYYYETVRTPSSAVLLDTVEGTSTNDGTGNVSNNVQRISCGIINAVVEKNLSTAVNDAETVSVKTNDSQTVSEGHNGTHDAQHAGLLSESAGSCCEKTGHEDETFTPGSSNKSSADDPDRSSGVPPALSNGVHSNCCSTVNDFMPGTPSETSDRKIQVATNAIEPVNNSAAGSSGSSTAQVLRIRRARVVQTGGAVFSSIPIGYAHAKSVVREVPALPKDIAGDSVRRNRPQSDGGDRLFASAPASALRQWVVTECRNDTGTVDSATAERVEIASSVHLKTAAETAQNNSKEEIEENRHEDNCRVGRTAESAVAPNLHRALPLLVGDTTKLVTIDTTLATRLPSHSLSPTPTATSQLQSSKVRLGAQPFLRTNSLPAFKPLSKLFSPSSPVSPGMANVSNKIDEQVETAGASSTTIQCSAQELNISCLVEAGKTNSAATEQVGCADDTARIESVLLADSNALCTEVHVVTCDGTHEDTSEGGTIDEECSKDDAESDKLMLAVNGDVAVSEGCTAPIDISLDISAEPNGKTTGTGTVSGAQASCTTHNELLLTDSAALSTALSLHRDTVTEAPFDAAPIASSNIIIDGSPSNTFTESEEVKTGAGREETVSVVTVNGSDIDSEERGTVGTNIAFEHTVEASPEVSGPSLCKQDESTQGTVILADKNTNGSVASSIDYAAIRRGVHARPMRKASWLVARSYVDSDDDDNVSTSSASQAKAGGPDELKLEGVEKERLDIINAMKVRRKTVDLKQEAASAAPTAPANAPAVGRHTIPNRIRRLSLDGSKHTVQIRSQPTTIVLRRPVSDLVKTLQQSSTNNEQ